MKKLILKTALITLGVAVIVLVAVFGLMSLWAPAAMMDLTHSLGLNHLSGDYAYQEYERSGNISYLARSFIVAAETGDNEKAEKRFEILSGLEGFEAFCDEQSDIALADGINADYRTFVYAEAVRVKYRTSSEDEWDSICQFAVDTTDESFPRGNPIVALATEAIANHDSAFCQKLLIYFVNAEKDFNYETADYKYIMEFLKDLIGGAYE